MTRRMKMKNRSHFPHLSRACDFPCPTKDQKLIILLDALYYSEDE
jgi:hypothetical protein